MVLFDKIISEIDNIAFRKNDEVFFLNKLSFVNLKKQIINEADPAEAKEMKDRIMAVNLNKDVFHKVPQIKDWLKEVEIILNFLSLSFLSDKEIFSLFESSVVFAIREELDVKKITELYLLLIVDDFNDSVCRKEIVKSIRNNNELIGSEGKKINVGNLGEKYSSLKNWLVDYELFFSNVKEKGALQESIYISNSPNVRKLNIEDRKILLNVLKFYDFLQTAIIIPKSFELLYGRKNIESAVDEDEEIMNKTDVVLIKSDDRSDTIVINTPPLALKQPSPAFLFDESDELEIDKLRPKVEAILAQGNLVLEQELRELANEVIKEHNFSFKDEISKKRFVQIFVSFIKDVRGVVEVREVLLKSLENGGLGLTTEKTDAVVKILRQAKKDFDLGLKKKPKARVSTELDKLIDGEAINSGYSIEKAVPKIDEADKYRKPVIPAKTAEDYARAEAARQAMLKDLAEKAALQKQADAIKQASDENKARNQMSDIKAPPRVLGPLEELKTLTLDDFRKLGNKPQDVIHKLLSKIDLLGERSVARRLEAVRSWQGSPVYRMYLTLGRESIENNKHVEVLIKEKEGAKELTLSLDEFNAIADFNTKLRF